MKILSMNNIDITQAPQAYNDGFAGDLISAGHPIIAVLLVVTQVCIFPLVIFLFKFYTAKSQQIAEDKKKIVDLETEIRKKERDKQIDLLQQEIKQVSMTLNFKDEEISQMLTQINKSIERLHTRIDSMEMRE